MRPRPKRAVISTGGKSTEERAPARDWNMGGGAVCGAEKKSGGTCTLPAGFGTTSPGFGSCCHHGGRRPDNAPDLYPRDRKTPRATARHEVQQEARRLLGHEREIDPLNALLVCIRYTYGEILFFHDLLGNIPEEDWLEDSPNGKQLHVWARQRQHAMDRLARYSEIAIKTGIAERAVRLQEAYAETMYVLFTSILRDLLDLRADNNVQLPGYVREIIREQWPRIVRKNFLQLDTGMDTIDAREVLGIAQTTATSTTSNGTE